MWRRASFDRRRSSIGGRGDGGNFVAGIVARRINRPTSVTRARVITLFSTLERARRSFLLDSAVSRRDIPPLKRDGGWRFSQPVSVIHRPLRRATPRVALRSFRLFRHAPWRNKSSRGTVRPETDFVRSAHRRPAAIVIDGDVEPRYISRSYRAGNNSLLGSTRNDHETNFLAARQTSPRVQHCVWWFT